MPIAAFWDYLASVQPHPARDRDRLPRREDDVHEPRLAQRPRRRLPRRACPLAADLRRLRRRRRRQRALPRPRRRRRPPHDGPSRGQGVDVHHARQLEPRARDRRRASARSRSSPGRSRRACCPASTCSRRCRASTSRGSSRHEPVGEVLLAGSSCSALIALAVWIRSNVAEFRAARRPGVHRRPHARALAPHRRRLAARRLGASAGDDLVHARRVPHRAVASATCCSSRRRRASRRSCRSARAASGRSRRSSSTRCAGRRRARRCSPSASA